jgi:hypothetical protein
MPRQDLIETRKQEILSYVQNFYRKSWDWRSTRFHERWNRCDRNFHAIYDPTRAAQKEPWQSTMFIDITFQNVEVVTSQIYKTMMAPNPPIQTEAGPAGDHMQARLIQDVVDYELRKSGFKLAFYDALKESVKYGSGFVKVFWEKVEDVRIRRSPIEQTPEQVVQGAPMEALAGQMPMPKPGIMGFEMKPTVVLLKNNLCARWVHIRDVFPEPNTTTWDKVIHRDKLTYGEICKEIKAGRFYDVKDQLENLSEGDRFEQDIQDIKQERGYFDIPRDMSKFEKRHTVWEMHNSIPRKWIQFDIEEGYDAEELVPAKVLVASGVALLSSDINAEFDGENPLLKMDYVRTGESYGKGVPEILFDDQDEINESGNLGIDNMNLILNKMVAVIESALVNPDQDLVSKPGAELRFRSNVEDVRKAIMPIEFPDLCRSFFDHRFNIERMVQEKTGVNRVTLGSSGMVKDTNQTLGGMELLKQMSNERSAAYGMVYEDSFMMRLADRIYGLIYQNLSPEDLKPILGEEPVEIAPPPFPGAPPITVPRFMAFAFVPPEEVGRSYRFKPMGIFTLENKVIKNAQFMDWTKVFAPVVNMPEAAKYSAQLQGNDDAEKMVNPMPMMPPPPPPGAEGPGIPGRTNKKDIPGARAGRNGNQPAFLPPNPVNQQPVLP